MFQRLLLGLVLGAIGGSAVGWLVGLVLGSTGPCASVPNGSGFLGAVLGAGLGAVAVLGARPDPSACNRQDPPDLLEKAAAEDDSPRESRRQ